MTWQANAPVWRPSGASGEGVLRWVQNHLSGCSSGDEACPLSVCLHLPALPARLPPHTPHFPVQPPTLSQAAATRPAAARSHHAALAAQGVPCPGRQRREGEALVPGMGWMLTVPHAPACGVYTTHADLAEEHNPHDDLALHCLNALSYPRPLSFCPSQVAVADLSLAIPRCECFGLLGPNGAQPGGSWQRVGHGKCWRQG